MVHPLSLPGNYTGTMAQPRVYQLKGVVQNYSWGGYDFLPALLGVDNATHKPFAEYWIGAHPNHPALLSVDNAPLTAHIERDPKAWLGAAHPRFATLPYLLK